jgi:hypothetical protein
MAEALFGLKEYNEATIKAKEALIACYHIRSTQNAMMITDIYSRIAASSHNQSTGVKELGDMLYEWYGNEQKIDNKPF